MTDDEARDLLVSTAKSIAAVKPQATGNDVAAGCWHVATDLLARGKNDDVLVFLRVASAMMDAEAIAQLLPKRRPKWRA